MTTATQHDDNRKMAADLIWAALTSGADTDAPEAIVAFALDEGAMEARGVVENHAWALCQQYRGAFELQDDWQAVAHARAAHVPTYAPDHARLNGDVDQASEARALRKPRGGAREGAGRKPIRNEWVVDALERELEQRTGQPIAVLRSAFKRGREDAAVRQLKATIGRAVLDIHDEALEPWRRGEGLRYRGRLEVINLAAALGVGKDAAKRLIERAYADDF
jgi:hypothetical protein